ncbi:hypothetical protein Tco_0038672 [Tanacetum coccineum]
MAQLLEAPTEGYEDAIVVPEINANFELKHGLINLVQNKQFFDIQRRSSCPHPIFQQDHIYDEVPERARVQTRSIPTKIGSNEDVPLSRSVALVYHESISKPVNAPVSASKPNQKASIPFPSRRNDERERREKANDQLRIQMKAIGFEFSKLLTDALKLYAKIRLDSKTLIKNKEKLEVKWLEPPLNENCSAVIRTITKETWNPRRRFSFQVKFSGNNTCNPWPDLVKHNLKHIPSGKLHLSVPTNPDLHDAKN